MTRKPSQKNAEARTDEWLTPPEIVAALHKLGPVVLDPCSHPRSVVGAELTIDAAEGLDGLAFPWEVEGLIYVNPPYSNLGDWLAKCAEESSREGVEIVALVPPRTDTAAFQACVFGVASAICFPKGRISFLSGASGERRKGNDTPSCVIYYGPRPGAFALAFGALGAVVPAR